MNQLDFFLRSCPPKRCVGLLVLAAVTISGSTLPLQAYPLQVLTTNVQPLSGTDNGGDEFPGAVLPFGMVQWSPDTTPEESGGYVYSATQIVGFGLDHLSGAGCDYGGDFDFTPILSAITKSPGTDANNGRNVFASTFSHNNETSAPGYYSVRFTNGILSELTATMRTGFGRFTYPAGHTAGMVINAGSGAAGIDNASIEINTNSQEISGWTTQYGFCGSGDHPTLYFDAVFDHPFAAFGVWSGSTLVPGGTNASGAASGVYLAFDLPSGGGVLARTAISYVSIANAQTNLQTESPAASFTSAGFDSLAAAASNNWNGYLNKIQITGGTMTDVQTFYTMMYHSLQAPSVVSDVNGQYLGFDGVVHTMPAGHAKHEFFSGWDIYRNECQFIAMMDPAQAGDIAESLVLDAQQCGAMPRWSVPNGDTGVMMGDPATPIVAGLYAFGGTNFDTLGALAAMTNAALNPATVALNGIHERDAERDYLNLGYVPAEESGGYGPVSMTLEYCSADCALARFALALGDNATYAQAMRRAQNWRNHFNPASGYLVQRNADALWSPGFPTFDGGAYVEGTAYQYVWMVPFNLASLAEMMGGPQAAAARLDYFFTQLNDGDETYSQYAYMGNEPCSEAPWIYDFLGEPYQASSVVRQILTQLYSTAPGGLPGNDDLGHMASWYVLAALGLHPEIPGDDVLVLNGPLFPQAIIHLTNGDVTITASGAADNAPYVQSLTVNGQPWNAPWIRFANIANGGTLAFTLAATPNTNWGSALSAAPPSYTDGMTTPLAGTCVWGTGLESNDIVPAWTNTTDTGPYPAGGITNVGPIVSGVSGPELGVRSENSESGYSELMYSGDALGGSPVCAYLKVFDLSAQNVTISPGMHFSYWIFPQSRTNFALVSGNNSLFAALDLIFTDGTALRNSGLTDQHGVPLNPTSQGSILALDTWNFVTVDLTPLAGKTVERIDFGYNRPGSSGGYRGYVDDLALTVPAGGWFTNNLALNQPASADSQETDNPAANGNDGNADTQWVAADGNTNHWWQVDLSRPCNLTGDEVLWPTNGAIYGYLVAVSLDSNTWTTVVNKTANTSTSGDQPDVFLAAARYVRVTITGLPPGEWAGFDEFRVFGSVIALPPAPAALQAVAGYGLVNLSWAASSGATTYTVARSQSSGAETAIASVAATNYIDFGLSNGVTYYYTVTASNLLGQSANSSEATITPTSPLAGSYAAALVKDHPLAYWPLGETNGSVAFDLVGGHNGTYVGGVTVGQPGVPLLGFGPDYSALFDGTSGYVDIPGGPFNLTNALTATAWVKIPSPTPFVGIVGHGDSSWRLTVTSGGDPGAADGGNGDATSSTSIVGTNWHMVAYTYNGVSGAANNGTLYVDGASKAHDTVLQPPGSSYDVWIGGSPDYGTSRLLPGSIAQVAVFTNALSGSQVLALYDASLVSPPVTLKAVPGADGRLTLSWLQGTLLQSTSLAGPWATNPATPPCTLNPTNKTMFFRVLVN